MRKHDQGPTEYSPDFQFRRLVSLLQDLPRSATVLNYFPAEKHLRFSALFKTSGEAAEARKHLTEVGINLGDKRDRPPSDLLVAGSIFGLDLDYIERVNRGGIIHVIPK